MPDTARSTTSRGRRWIARGALALAVAGAAYAVSARRARTYGAQDAASDAGAHRARPKSARELPTTSGGIFLANLDDQIDELTRLTGAEPDLVQNFAALSAAHHTRARVRGDLDEMQLGIDLASRCVERAHDAPDTPPTARLDAKCLLMRAEQEQSLHRFKESRADVARARALGVDAERAADLEAELDWNDGKYEPAIARIREARRRHPSTATWMREAQLDHDLGRDADADAAFDAAEDAIRDTNPLVVAHLDVQRGIQKVSIGRLDEAIAFFRAAVERVSTHVAALEHLGETLAMNGERDEAIAIYERVLSLSDDPEFQHALGALYASAGRADKGAELEAKARAGYARLLEKYPEAMYWHASEYFMAIGDAPRALELLEKNVALRPGSPSFVALARAQLATGHAEGARASIDRALAMPIVSADLFWTASRVYRALGESARADELRARATAINPRVARE